MKKNPDKYIRAAYLQALASVGAPVYSKLVPKSVNPVPSTYILISTQTKQRAAISKCGYEWECSILVDMISVQEDGFADIEVLDDLEEKVINAIEALITIPGGFVLKSSYLEDSYESDVDTDTQSIWRKLVRYAHRVGMADL